MLSKLSTGTSDNNSIDDPVLEVLGGILTSTTMTSDSTKKML